MELTSHLSKRRKYSQAGITLLLSILVLAAIMAISFSLTTIIFIELRSSSDSLKSEGSLYGATGIGEQALFNLKRQACTGNTGCYTANYSNNVTLPLLPQQVLTNTPILNDKVPTNSTFASTLKRYELCSTNPSYDLSSNENGCGYGKLTVNYVVSNNTSDSLNIYLCEWDQNQNYQGANPCNTLSTSGTVQPYWKAPSSCTNGCFQSDGSVTLTPTFNTVSWTLDPTKQQELIVTNSSGNSDIYYSIVTYAADGITPKGMPFVGSTAMNIQTTNGSVGRKVQVNVPNPGTSASGGPPFVQGAFDHQFANAPYSVTLPNPVTSGDTLAAFFNWNYPPCAPVVTDSLGNSFTMASGMLNAAATYDPTGTFWSGDPLYNPGGSGWSGNYSYLYLAQVNNPGTDTITVSGCSWSGYDFFMEYRGLSTTNTLDSTGEGYPGGYPNPNNICQHGSVTASQANELVVALYLTHYQMGPGVGYNGEIFDGNNDMIEDQVLTTNGVVYPSAYCQDVSPWHGPNGAYYYTFRRQ